MQIFINRNLSPKDRAKLDNAVGLSKTNAQNDEDIMAALVELGELFAAQDDALVELAELITE